MEAGVPTENGFVGENFIQFSLTVLLPFADLIGPVLFAFVSVALDFVTCHHDHADVVFPNHSPEIRHSMR